MQLFKWVLTLTLIFNLSHLYAKTFTNQFTEFELPNGWDCALEGSEWVCQSSDKDRKKEAIIILAAKVRGEQDSLDEYQAYLKKPKSFGLPGGKQQISEAKSVVVKTVNSHSCVDALHLASEVPGFYTRYLATVKENLGVAVTFSVAREHYSEYQDIFEKIVASLKVFSQKNTSDLGLVKKKEENLLEDSTSTVGMTDPNADLKVNAQNSKKSNAQDEMYMYGALLLVVIVFVLMKLRKKK